MRWCPVCPTEVIRPCLLDSIHVLLDCRGIEQTRVQHGVSDFVTSCWEEGRGREWAFRAYVTGLDSMGNKVSRENYMSRGQVLGELQEEWLAAW